VPQAVGDDRDLVEVTAFRADRESAISRSAWRADMVVWINVETSRRRGPTRRAVRSRSPNKGARISLQSVSKRKMPGLDEDGRRSKGLSDAKGWTAGSAGDRSQD
jgi:hypothetical protein